MGEPSSTAAISDEETFRYNLYNFDRERYEEYWVVFINGEVYQYGRAGDYQKKMDSNK